MLSSGYTLEGGGQAVLLLHNYASSPETVRPLVDALRVSGLSVCVPCLFMPGCSWTAWFTEARRAFVELSDRHVCVSICAQGEGVWPALMLAGWYNVEELLILPETVSADRHDKRSLIRFKRRALRSLFAVTARTRILLPKNASRPTLRMSKRLERLLGHCPVVAYAPERLPEALEQCFNLSFLHAEFNF